MRLTSSFNNNLIIAHPTYIPYSMGWSGYGGGYHQDNDVTIVNNYNVDYNIEQSVPTNDTDWVNYDDYEGGYEF